MTEKETSHQREDLVDLNEGIRSLLTELEVDVSSTIVASASSADLGGQISASMAIGGGQGSGHGVYFKGGGVSWPPPGVPQGFQPVEAVLDLEVAVEKGKSGGLAWSLLTLGASKKSTRTHRMRITYRPPTR